MEKPLDTKPSYVVRSLEKQKSADKDGKIKGWNAAINDHEKQLNPDQFVSDIRDNITTSVLACLQSSISVDQIVTQVLKSKKAACGRCGAFRLIDLLLTPDTKPQITTDLIAWFI